MTTPPPTASDSMGQLCERLRGLHQRVRDSQTPGDPGDVVVNFDALTDLLANLPILLDALESPKASTLDADRAKLRAEIINTPETADFMAGVPLEAAHQRERWGVDHDGGKTPFDWFWLIGYLAQKAASAQVAGDHDKAMHHTISTAAALANWHAAISGADTSMRPGIATPEGDA